MGAVQRRQAFTVDPPGPVLANSGEISLQLILGQGCGLHGSVSDLGAAARKPSPAPPDVSGWHGLQPDGMCRPAVCQRGWALPPV
ncbi:hypothetical protein GCM10011452_35850 [Gemmobacter lanyuensis]|uniref:Uncharacterized protein n=1 Tax=Gemmobacter lanyuensis TaxID=1054497 RepID=A0A918J5T0_9RHOB|nr:hypothetical protein GCM10011452_35850 [Gemmobacter lanyuensis]